MSAGDLFTLVLASPAAQSLLRRVETGGVLSCDHVNPAAVPFLAALLHRQFPDRPIVVVTDGLKAQERFHQDVQTWIEAGIQNAKLEIKKADSGPASGIRHPASAPPLFYPAWEILPHESKLPHADVVSERLETLVALAAQGVGVRKNSKVVVTNVVALLQLTFPAEELASRTRIYRRGDRIEPMDLIEWLEEQGYEPEAQVTEKGQISLRGGIVDLFPLTSPWPVRLEFFGDELESLRYFDPITQISKEEIAAITIPPGGELGLLRQTRNREGGGRGSADVATLLDYLPDNAIFLVVDPDVVDDQARRYREQVPAGEALFVSWDELCARIEKRGMTWIETREEEPELSAGIRWESEVLDESGDLAPQKLALSSQPSPPVGEKVPEGRLRGTLADAVSLNASSGEMLSPHFQGLEVFRPIGDRPPEPQIAEAQRREFFGQLHRWSRQGFQVHVFCNNEGEQQRFHEVWRELGFVSDSGSGLQTHLGALSRGFIFEEARLVVVTDSEIFGRYKTQRPRRLKSPHAQTSRSLLDIDFTELEEGDYVVHLEHGIGRYLGLRVMPTGAGLRVAASGSPPRPPQEQGQECLVIEYAPSDPRAEAPKLYVPVSEAHLVSKYVGTGKARPPLHSLGGTRWAKAKAQAVVAVRDLAAEMLSIQAARESQAGHSFPTDSTWQREFEGSFVYEETPDQMKAILATKTDMEIPKPMDRLICGDVGYGKTEVAIRAAFKAVMGGKQVAILVPTTVLAQQHFNTFRERMSDYPVRIELLSRFRTKREQTKVMANLASGLVDIVIGTHRLVQPDIQFKDLGLVVIDEEQRFGVRHKEQFKLLRRLVDVLTLSATPIPRTLYLALTGARDMSTIETPPQDRLPVETIVTQFDERVIRDAIQREINRQGQVFFLHNRVGTIDAMATRLKALLPNARILVGHGQLEGDDLEQVMTAFVNGEADVLLSTTIIESGLDIPNANTIIIDRADRFGLSELYQLRGRVGRYKHQAFAYLLLPRHAGLLADARKRISAIKQYSSLGSGFKIAMRDLEIRGAGNLLGSQQSGHITAVGFDLYCQLLQQSVSALKGEKVKTRVEVKTRIDFLAMSPDEESSQRGERRRKMSERPKEDDFEVSVPRDGVTWYHESVVVESEEKASEPVIKTPAYVPFNYVSDPKQRIEIYRKLAQIAEKPALEQLKKEMRDRFGPVPAPVELLLQLGELKVLAAEKGITSLEVRDDKLMLTRNRDLITVGGRFPRLTKKEAGARLKEIKRLLLAL